MVFKKIFIIFNKGEIDKIIIAPNKSIAIVEFSNE